MDNLYRILLIALLVVQSLILISCGSTSPIGGASAPIEPGPDASGVGNDRGDAVSKDLANVVEKIKGRNLSLAKRGVFFSLGLLDLKRTADSGDERTGSDKDITNVSIGYDQAISNQWVLGALLDASRTDASSSTDTQDFSNSSDSLSFFLFSNLALNETFEVSSYVGRGRADISSMRNTEGGVVDFPVQPLQVARGEVRGDTNSSIVSAGLIFSRRLLLSEKKQLTLSAEADFSRIAIDAFTEQGSTNSELAYQKDVRETLRWILRGGFSRTFNSSVGVFVPTVTLAYINEDPDDDTIEVSLVSSPNRTADFEAAATDRNYGKLDLTLVWVRPHGIQMFGNINTNFKNRYEETAGVTVGGRLEF